MMQFLITVTLLTILYAALACLGLIFKAEIDDFLFEERCKRLKRKEQYERLVEAYEETD